MKYRGQIGEFEPLGFACWLAGTLVLALMIFYQFTFTTKPSDIDLTQVMAQQEALSKEVRQIDDTTTATKGSVRELDHRVARIEEQLHIKQKRPVGKR